MKAPRLAATTLVALVMTGCTLSAEDAEDLLNAAEDLAKVLEEIAANSTVPAAEAEPPTMTQDPAGPILRWDASDAGSDASRVRDASGNRADGRFLSGLVMPGDPPVFFFDGVEDVLISERPSAALDEFTLAFWLRTSEPHGKIAGFESYGTLIGRQYDRQVYFDDSGRLHFGVWSGAPATVNASETVADDVWHHVAASAGATGGPDGLRLWLDGRLVGESPNAGKTFYEGHWRLGGGNLDLWSSGARWFNGSISLFEVYPRVLSDDEVAALADARPGEDRASEELEEIAPEVSAPRGDPAVVELLRPQSLVDAQAATFEAIVANRGDAPTQPFLVRFRVADESLDEVAVGSLEPGQEATLTSPAWMARAGAALVRAAIVPAVGMNNTDPTNDQVEIAIDVAEAPPAFRVEHLRQFPTAARAGDRLTVAARVTNDGGPAQAPRVALLLDDTELDVETPAVLARGESVELRATTIATAGQHVLSVRTSVATASEEVGSDSAADPISFDVSARPEPRPLATSSRAPARANGSLPFLRFEMGSIVERPDVAVAALLTRSDPIEGFATSFIAVIVNNGTASSGPFRVRFYLDGAPLGEAEVPGLSPRGTFTVESEPWRATSGSHRVAVVADPLHATRDVQRANNLWASDVTPEATGRPPDARLLGVTVTPNGLVEGERAVVAATVANEGGSTLAGGIVRFTLGGEHIGEAILPALDPGASIAVFGPRFRTTEGTHEVEARVYAEGDVEPHNDSAVSTLVVGGSSQ